MSVVVPGGPHRLCVIFSVALPVGGASSPGTTSRTSAVPELLSLQSVTVLVCLSECRVLQLCDIFVVVCFTDVFTTSNLTGNS